MNFGYFYDVENVENESKLENYKKCVNFLKSVYGKDVSLINKRNDKTLVFNTDFFNELVHQGQECINVTSEEGVKSCNLWLDENGKRNEYDWDKWLEIQLGLAYPLFDYCHLHVVWDRNDGNNARNFYIKGEDEMFTIEEFCSSSEIREKAYLFGANEWENEKSRKEIDELHETN